MTQAAGTTAVRAHESFRHEAYVYSGTAEFVTSTAAFVREGVAAGQPVMVAVVQERLDPLRRALGADADGVHFVDMAELGRNPAGIIPAWCDFVAEHGGPGRPTRGVGEPIWAGRRRPEILECQLHEALLNMAVSADNPLWLRCPYDISALDEWVVREMRRSHPVLVDSDQYRGSTSYGGSHLVKSLFTDALEPSPPDSLLVRFDAGDLDLARSLVRDSAKAAGLDADKVDDLVLAVHELTTNSVLHGGGTGRLSAWTEPGAVVFEVHDAGVIRDPLAGRHRPEEFTMSGRGLWLANNLCDLVQLRSGPAGTTVRVRDWTD